MFYRGLKLVRDLCMLALGLVVVYVAVVGAFVAVWAFLSGRI